MSEDLRSYRWSLQSWIEKLYVPSSMCSTSDERNVGSFGFFSLPTHITIGEQMNLSEERRTLRMQKNQTILSMSVWKLYSYCLGFLLKLLDSFGRTFSPEMRLGGKLKNSIMYQTLFCILYLTDALSVKLSY